MRRSWPRAVLVVLAVATLVAVVVAGATSTTAFGTYNAAWDGASDLRARADAVGSEGRVLTDASGYAAVEGAGTVAVVLSPETAYGPEAAGAVREFVRDGGTLLVAEDYGPHGNALLAAVGARARVDGRPLRDEREYYRSPDLPVATTVSQDPLVAGVDELALNHGTAVSPNGATVVVASSEFAYLDANGNEALDDAETVRRYPVATVERVGAGRVIVLSDPSALINVMLDRPGNRAFVDGLFAAHERVLLDASHAGALPPLSYALLVLRETPVLQGVVGILVLAALGVLLGRSGAESARGPRGPTREALRAGIEARHPEWDETRLGRLVRGLITGRDERGDDG